MAEYCQKKWNTVRTHLTGKLPKYSNLSYNVPPTNRLKNFKRVHYKKHDTSEKAQKRGTL